MKNTTSFVKYLLLFGVILFSKTIIAAPYAAGACSPIPNTQTCVDTTSCKTNTSGTVVCLAGNPLPAGAIGISQTCWQYSYQYACSASDINTCSTYQNNANCSLISSSCMDTIATSGQCDEWQNSYKCQTQAAVTQQQLLCGDSMLDPLAMPTPSNQNHSFTQAAIAQELISEGSTYDNAGILFTGVQETCTKGYAGLKNCCKSLPGAQSNSVVSEIALGAGASVVKYAGSQAIDWASPYVFDAMYNNGIFQDALISNFSNYGGTDAALNLGTNLGGAGLSLGAYGFTYSTLAPLTTGLGGANMTFSVGNGFVTFNPYSLAAAIAIQVVMDLISCDQNEQMLGMHKGAGLSTYIKEDCTGDILGWCYEYTDTYCSFNSVLAKTINIQGKSQLGLDISNCQGITTDQLSKIDFSKVDFGEFTQSLLQNAQNHSPTSTAIKNGYTPVLQNATQGTNQKTTSPALPAYP